MQHSYASLLDSIKPLNLLSEEAHISLPDELTLQSMWFNGQFGRDFLTTDGKKVHITQFGFWNRGAGPDFEHASISIDGEPFSGPLEIDTQPSDWEQHGHDTNPAFNDTILHVVFRASNQEHFTRTENHSAVPKVVIPESVILPALNTPLHQSAPAHLGRCHRPLEKMDTLKITNLLEQAAKHRCLTKARKLIAIQDAHGKDQALWIALAETLGYRPNKLSMALLAQRLPISELKKEKNVIPSLLFGVAEYLHPDIHKEAPEDSREWLEHLWDTWWQHRTNHQLDSNRSIPWVKSGIRPINHPQRRLAVLSAIASQWNTFRKLSTQPKAVAEWLTNLTDSFWNHHYTLTSKRSDKKLALLGKDRINDLITNHLLPIQIAEGDEHAWQSYLSLPAPAINEKVKRAHFRLFGKHPEASLFLKKAWHHQALLQIYQDFCLADTSDCKDCPFPEQLREF